MKHETNRKRRWAPKMPYHILCRIWKLENDVPFPHAFLYHDLPAIGRRKLMHIMHIMHIFICNVSLSNSRQADMSNLQRKGLVMRKSCVASRPGCLEDQGNNRSASYQAYGYLNQR